MAALRISQVKNPHAIAPCGWTGATPSSANPTAPPACCGSNFGSSLRDLGKLGFSWKVPMMISGADMTQRDSDDSPVRVLLAFEGDRSRFSAKNAMLSELALALTGEPLPYATLMYVWGTHSAPESVVINPRTDRIRKLVLESGPARLGRWLDYERDIRADYEKAFGEAPGALVGIAIMTDSDNTRQKAKAWYGPVSLVNKTLNATAVPAVTALLRPGFHKALCLHRHPFKTSI
jgi:hypothetical protein